MNPRSHSLETQLASYSKASQSRKPASDWAKRWPLYAAAAGSALALTTSAQAAIVYSGVQNITETLPHAFTGAAENAGTVISIDGASFAFGVNQFIRNAFHYGVANLHAHGSNQIGELPNPRYGINLANKLSSGAKISGGQLFGGYAYLHFQSSTGARGQFVPGQTGLVGLKIGTGAAEHFGWLRMEFQNTAHGYPGSITAIDWAYNSIAGQSINAGQESSPSAAPEPGTTSLALLAAGSAGVLAWRNRRRQIAA